MQYSSMNIEKQQKRMKSNFSILHIKLDGGEMILKKLFLQNPILLKAITVMNQTLEGYILCFWKNIFRPKYIDLVRSVQSCSVYRYVATSAKHFSVANTSMDSVVNVTLNLARRSNTILNRMIWYKQRKEDEK